MMGACTNCVATSMEVTTVLKYTCEITTVPVYFFIFPDRWYDPRNLLQGFFSRAWIGFNPKVFSKCVFSGSLVGLVRVTCTDIHTFLVLTLSVSQNGYLQNRRDC